MIEWTLNTLYEDWFLCVGRLYTYAPAASFRDMSDNAYEIEQEHARTSLGLDRLGGRSCLIVKST